MNPGMQFTVLLGLVGLLVSCTSTPSAPETAGNPPQNEPLSLSQPEASSQGDRVTATATEEAAAAATSRDAGASAANEPTGPAGDEAPVSPPSAQPFPKDTKVLHIGDSFAGALGLPLGQMLEDEGVRSVLKHTDSSYLTTWAWEKDLTEYLWKYNPDLVLVTLGANELGIAEPERRTRTVKKIVATIGERPCVWVAIPLWDEKHNGLMEVIRESSSPCVFYDSNRLLDAAHMGRISDGIHPTKQARADWAREVFGWLKEHRAPKDGRPWNIAP